MRGVCTGCRANGSKCLLGYKVAAISVKHGRRITRINRPLEPCQRPKTYDELKRQLKAKKDAI